MSFSLKSLRAFESVVRNGGVGRAAVELGVTQPAVSQRLRQFEESIGRRLVRRTGQGIAVEPEAELFAARVKRALDEIDQAATALIVDRAGELTVSLLATFAQRWLIPRLSRFQDGHPDLDIRLLTTSREADLARRDVDLSIQCGAGRWAGCTADFLMHNRIGLVAAPGLIAQHPVRDPGDLADHVLIRIDAVPRVHDWPEWLAGAGVPDLAPRRWLTFSTSTQALEAAVAGLGIAISHGPFVADAMVSGRLIRPLAMTRPSVEGDYYLVSARSDDRPKIRAFRRWLLTEGGATQTD